MSCSATGAGRMPCAFFGHGGGPLPLLGQQPEVAAALSRYSSSVGKIPTAICVITAHWVAETISVNSGPSPQLLFDYGGFPAESYQYSYPAPGSPQLAAKIQSLLTGAGIPSKLDPKRAWDHGVFVPMMLMYPAADIPIVSVSLQASYDPTLHISMGRALAPLRDEGVLIIGSGMSFHNFDYFFARDTQKKQDGVRHSHAWNDFLLDTLASGLHPREEQVARLTSWSSAPSAAAAHPLGQQEHLMPLHVILGAAGEENSTQATCIGSASDETELAFSNFEWK